MLKLPPSRIELRMEDLQEFDALRAQARSDGGVPVRAAHVPIVRTAAERIGLAAPAAAAAAAAEEEEFLTPVKSEAPEPKAAAAVVKGWRAVDGHTWVILFNVVLYAVAFQMQTPLQPFLVSSLSEDGKTAFAQLRTVNACFQLLGSLLSGVLIDRLGSKPVLVLSVVASAVSYGITAAAESFLGLAVAQVPTLLQHLMLGARAYVSIEGTPDPSFKTVLLGYIGVAYGVGFVIGPSLGGFLAKHVSLRFAAVVACALSVASALWLQFALPSPRGGAAPASKDDADKKEAGEADARGWCARLADGPRAISATPALRSLFTDKLIFSFSLAIFHAVFSLIAKERFGLDSQAVGLLMSAVGVVGIAAQASLQAVLARVSEDAVAAWSAAALAVSFGGLVVASNAVELALVSVPISVFGTVFSLITTAAISREAPAAVKGSLVAADMAIFSGVRLVTPTIGTFMFATYYWSLGVVTGLPVAGIAVKLLLRLAARGKNHSSKH